MSRGVPYETIMALPLEAIQQNFPHGARTVSKERWAPADSPENAVKTLDRLIKEKRQRLEQPRYLRQSYSRDNYTHIPNQAVGKDKHGRGAPEEAVPKDVQEHQSRKAEEDFIRDQGRPYGMDGATAARTLAQRVEALEGKARPQQLASLRQRIERLERAVHDKAA